MNRTALYRHFGADGVLLYVGISNDVLRRLLQHSERSGWFRRIARVEVEWLSSRRAALDAEALAIQREAPRWNRYRPRVKPDDTAWYVLHPRSGRFDGWYVGRDALENAEGVRDYFAETFPRESFALGSRPRPDCFPIGRVLRPSESHLWASA